MSGAHGSLVLTSRCMAGAVLTATLCLSPAVSKADIYKYIDKYGRVTLTDRPDHSGFQTLVKTWKGWVPKSIRGNPNFARDREKYAPAIAAAARKQNLPVELVHAVVTAESAYDPNAVSSAGAVGLMQLMPETAQRYGVTNRSDPVASVHGGTSYLRDLMQLFNRDVTLAVAAYNAGENAVISYGNKIPPYPETQEYVRRVLRYYREYSSNGVVKPSPTNSGTNPAATSAALVIRPAVSATATRSLNRVANVKWSTLRE